jgi:hypothetical protein
MTGKRIERASEHPGTIRESPVDNAQEIKSSWAFSTNIFCTFVAFAKNQHYEETYFAVGCSCYNMLSLFAVVLSADCNAFF